MLDEIYDFKLVAMFSKEYGHIADLSINESGLKTSVYGHTAIPEDAISYFALNEVDSITSHLEQILLSKRPWESILQPTLIEESLELLSASNDNIDPQKTLSDISKYLIVTRSKDGKLNYYYYKRNDNITPGSNLTYLFDDGKSHEVGADLAQILTSLQQPVDDDSVGARFYNREYEILLSGIYNELSEKWKDNHKHALTRSINNVPAVRPNSKVSKHIFNKAREGIDISNNEHYEVITSNRGQGANVPFFLKVDRWQEENEDEVNGLIDYIEATERLTLPLLARDIYSSICAFYQYLSPNEDGVVKVSLRDLLGHVYQKSRDGIKHLKQENYIEALQIIKKLSETHVEVFVDEELKQFHVNDPEKYGVMKTVANGRVMAGYVAAVEWDQPARYDIKTGQIERDIGNTILEIFKPPILLMHDTMIKQVQTIPSEMMKLRGLYPPDKTVLISELESRIMHQKYMLKYFEEKNVRRRKKKLRKADLKSNPKKYGMYTTIVLKNLYLDLEYAEENEDAKDGILFLGVDKDRKCQNNKRNRINKDIISYFEEQLKSGFITSFEVVREDGGYTSSYLRDGEVFTKTVKPFKKNARIVKIRFYCVK